MNYAIESKSDLFTGVSLIVRIPEAELDRKALHTIQADKPDFVLPFRSRYIDGQVEFVYQVGTNSNLQYLSGERLPKEYAELWTYLLRPLLDCGDWFMNPYSFALSVKHLYFDKNTKAVRYIYIPSIQRCSGYTQLKEMAADVSRLISVCDADLENKVLRAIMKDFNPADFLRMLKPYMVANAIAMTSWPTPAMANGLHTSAPIAPPSAAPTPKPGHKAAGEYKVIASSDAPAGGYSERLQSTATKPGEVISSENAEDEPGDIIINIHANRKPERKSGEKSEKKSKEKEKKVDTSNRKKEKDKKKQKSTGDLPGRKKGGKQEIHAGAAYAPQSDYKPAPNAMHVYAPSPDPIDITQCVSTELSGARLRLIGSAFMPQIINVRITDGEFFTVGRFDAAVGRKQSSFEFDKKSKAISRRHAVIERHAGGYNIIDLSSSAGTFLNGDKLPPNAPCGLINGSRVSFGNAGADYIWESA